MRPSGSIGTLLLLATACVTPTPAPPASRGKGSGPCALFHGQLETWQQGDGQAFACCRIDRALVPVTTLERSVSRRELTAATTLFMGAFPAPAAPADPAEAAQQCDDEHGVWTTLTRGDLTTGLCAFADGSAMEGLTMHGGFLTPGYRALADLIDPEPSIP